jgi:hypothetical protein
MNSLTLLASINNAVITINHLVQALLKGGIQTDRKLNTSLTHDTERNYRILHRVDQRLSHFNFKISHHDRIENLP